MSKKGDCYDNAPMESFFGSLKNECVHQTRFKTRKEAKAALFEYIEMFYNRRRLHSGIGYRTAGTSLCGDDPHGCMTEDRTGPVF